MPADRLAEIPASPLARLPTPCLLLDEAKMVRNIDRLAVRANDLGVTLRPHCKTTKSVDVARRLLSGGCGPATVSTLAEAEVLAAAGVRDILYAVGIAPQKLARVVALRQGGCDLKVILDSQEQAEAVTVASRRAGVAIPALIEIDCDGHRGGLRPDDPELLSVGRALHIGAKLIGVMVHAGASYSLSGRAQHAAAAERERGAAVAAAEALRAAGLPCDVVSVGATPTAHAAQNLTGVTELRAGVYVFFDLMMAEIGVCRLDDIALSVLTTVIGRQTQTGRLLIDAGWMALSRDRGGASEAGDAGYGRVCDEAGRPLGDLVVTKVSQEHGVIAPRPGGRFAAGLDLPLGTRLRILPNHACATAAQHRVYHVLPADPGAPLARWPRFGGW